MCLKHQLFDSIIFFLNFFSVPLSSFFFTEIFSSNTRGVHPPNLQGQLTIFHFGALDLFLKQETTRNFMTAMRKRKLHLKWWFVRLLCLSSGMDYQNAADFKDTLLILSSWIIKYKYIFLKEENKGGDFQATFMMCCSTNLTYYLKK